ncbi:MAG: hypothetical protein ACTHOG_03485 [Marmoricola sp.]
MTPNAQPDRGPLTPDELADEMSEESFPGSDPPSTYAGPDTKPSTES